MRNFLITATLLICCIGYGFQYRATVNWKADHAEQVKHSANLIRTIVARGTEVEQLKAQLLASKGELQEAKELVAEHKDLLEQISSKNEEYLATERARQAREDLAGWKPKTILPEL